ncbi:cystathionine gamma-synthase [Entamoeba marina]
MTSHTNDVSTQLLHPEHPTTKNCMHSHAFPIFQTSTYSFESTEHGANICGGKADGHVYSRISNPTVEVFENMVKEVEHAAASAAFGSGMGAIHTATFAHVKSGDHVICSDTIYGCAVSLFTHWAPHFGIEVSMIDTSNVENIKSNWKQNTKMVYFETPANPTNRVSPIAETATLCHERGARLVVDGTFTTPIFMRPLELGADIVVHSVTKYINGHGDVVGGVASTKTKEDMDIIKEFRKDAGSLMSPHDAFLCIRGMKTLAMRMKMHNENGMAVAQYLEKHEKIEKVNHPGLESFEGHEIAIKQQTGFGSTFSFEMKSFEAAKTLMEKVKICTLAVSLGCIDTLIEHPASMTHAGVPETLMKQQGISKTMVRISVGIEKVEDIIHDLEQALEQC